VESPCLFADSAQWGKVLGGGSGEVAVHAARPPDGGDGSESAAASAVPVAVAGDAADAEVRVVAAPDEGAAGTPVENTRVGADKPLAQGGILSLGSVRRALTNSTESDWGCAGGTFRVGQVDASGTVILLGSERVRLIGVRIEDGGPPNGEEGFALTSVEGACVKLRFDDANRVAGHRDHQGRLLAYVFLSDGTFVNLELIRAGLAKPLVTARYEYLGDFMAAQSEARSAGRGIWERSR
jgi:micrococcal nuclease